MNLKDELKLRIHSKIRERFELEEQKKLAKNYYALFRDELVNISIEAFIDFRNGVEIEETVKMPVPGPRSIYNKDGFLQELGKLLEQGHKYKVISDVLGVSSSTITRGKQLLIQRGVLGNQK